MQRVCQQVDSSVRIKFRKQKSVIEKSKTKDGEQKVKEMKDKVASFKALGFESDQ